MKYVTLVGSRETPLDLIPVIKEICSVLVEHKYTGRSGGADGADSMFEAAMNDAGGIMEVYLPWRSFNKHVSNYYNVSDAALRMASTTHPAWDKLSQGAQKLHARNCYQVLGYNLDTPSSLLICWTPGGAKTGGTRTAIVLAEQNNIPVFNLATHATKDIINYIRGL